MKKQKIKIEPKKKVDILLDEYTAVHQHPSNKLIHFVCIPLIILGILGLAWSIPFPHLAFLGRYNGFLNWASFVIAFSGYYYYRLSPVFSYAVILAVFLMALIIVQLEKWTMAGGPAIWLVCTVVLILAGIAQFIGYKIEGKRVSFMQHARFLMIGPLWILKFLWIKMGLK